MAYSQFVLFALIVTVCGNDKQGKYLEGGLEGIKGNKITIQSYQEFEETYAKEFIRPLDSSSSHSQFTFVQQKDTLSAEAKNILENLGFNPFELDFQSEEPISDNAFISQAFIEERKLLKKHQENLEQMDPLIVFDDHVKMILEKTMTVSRSMDPNDLLTSSLAKDSVATYILHKFASLGYLTALQKFQPMFFIDSLPSFENMPPLEGTNIIAISPGRKFGTNLDRIVVVGAHWDTVTNSPGYNDNGSGVSGLIEIARALKQSGCQNENTYILVALDMEETGTQGAAAFVQDFLVNTILKPMGFPQFQGAFILDSIGNFNDSVGSQLLPEPYLNQLPDFSRTVTLNQYRGDFIGAVGREVDQQLLELLAHHWKHDSTREEFNLYNMILPKILSSDFPTQDSLVRNSNFLRSDHTRFWFVNNKDFYASFSAVHLSDTGPARGVMSDCYHNYCDTSELNNTVPFANMNFLKKTIQTMIDVIVEMTDSKCPNSRRVVRRSGKNVDSTYVFLNKADYTILQNLDHEDHQLNDNDLDENPVKSSAQNYLSLNQNFSYLLLSFIVLKTSSHLTDF